MPRHQQHNLILRNNERIVIGDNPDTQVVIYHDGTHFIAQGLATDEELITTSGTLQIQLDGKENLLIAFDGGEY